MIPRAIGVFLLTTIAISAEEITVATWNMNHLAAQENTGCNPRVQADYDAIRAVINKIDADIWMFQEVESVGALARIMDSSQWKFAAEARQDPYNPGMCDDGINTWTMQRTITAVKKNKKIVSRASLRFLDINNKDTLRYGTSVTVLVNGYDVEFINVHLKSGCKSGAAGSACEALFEQIPYVAAYASERSKEGRALLIAGDFNRTLAEAGDGVLNTLSYNKDLGLKLSSHTGQSACSTTKSKPIDYQITSRIFRETFDVENEYETSFSGHPATWPSDHCPVVVRYTLK